MTKRVLKGKVVSDKNKKTIIVLVERKYQHPVLKKVMKAKKKYSVHDEENKYKNGDPVSIIECKPRSKTKKFEVFGESKWFKFKQNYLWLIIQEQKE